MALFSRKLPQNFALMPKRIVALDEQGKAKHFRWRANRYGQVRIEPQSEFTPFTGGQKCVVCLDPKLLFHRRCSMPIAGKQDLGRIARDFFPFGMDQAVHFAYAKDGQDPNNDLIFALTDQDWQNLQKTIPAPASAVLPASADMDAIKSVLGQRFNLGAVADLLAKPAKFFPPAKVAFAKLLSLLIVLLIAGYGLWQFQSDWQSRKLSGEIAALQAEIQPVQQRFQALQKMQTTLQDFSRFQAEENNQIFATLSRLIQTLPLGISIDRIEYKDGKLNISGLGRDPKEWLGSFGVAPSDIEITPLPQYNRYVASVPVSSTAPKQPLQP